MADVQETVAGALGELLGRSHRLGADKRVTNFAGGNTSAKLTLPDPVTGRPTRVLAVKGSGGDLGTLAASGVALLVLERSVPPGGLGIPPVDNCRLSGELS